MRTPIPMLCLVIAARAWASDASAQRDAYMDGKGQLDALLARAEQGTLSQERLRRERRRVESRIDRALADAPTDLRPGELTEISAARTEMHQSLIRSHEFEFFGPQDRPEWGWYPSRRVASTGSTLSVERDGRASYSALR